MNRTTLLAVMICVCLLVTNVVGAPRPPGQPSSPMPQNGASGISVTALLSWTPPPRAQRYDVALGTVNPPPLVSVNQTATTYQPALLTAGTTYYWRVDARNSGGTTTGVVWTFTTAAGAAIPGPPIGPSPADGAALVPIDAVLTWTASDANSYDVSFGTTIPPPLVSSNQPAALYAPSSLTSNTLYYWQVTARNSVGATPGPVWSFFTEPASPPPPTTIHRLKLLTWNIQRGYDATDAEAVDAQVALLADSNADVIGLNEVNIEPGRDLSTLYETKLENITGVAWDSVWAPVPFAAGLNPSGNLILSRIPIASSSIVQWDVAPADPTWLGTKRSAAQIELVINGRSINVFFTHLDTDVGVRNAQLTRFLNWVQTYPAPRVLGGDFNMMPSEGDYLYTTGQFRDAWATLVDAFQAAPGPDQGYTKDLRTIAPWTGQPGRIDYWFHELTETGATPTEVGVIKTRRSDHNGVFLWVDVR